MDTKLELTVSTLKDVLAMLREADDLGEGGDYNDDAIRRIESTLQLIGENSNA